MKQGHFEWQSLYPPREWGDDPPGRTMSPGWVFSHFDVKRARKAHRHGQCIYGVWEALDGEVGGRALCKRKES